MATANDRPVPFITADGSHSLCIGDNGATYHSRHGALQESQHIFINAGLGEAVKSFSNADPLRVFEMGFGTGLNALLTAVAAKQLHRKIDYTALELYPVETLVAEQLNYGAITGEAELFECLHTVPWNESATISGNFTLTKLRQDLLTYQPEKEFYVVYFDAFAPGEQPELWTEAVFKKLFDATVPGGNLVTYCSKSIVRKAMQAVGYTVEKLQGPRGKREILRAVRDLANR